MSVALDEKLLCAHAHGDAEQLVSLYWQAADLTHCPDQAAFFLTQAYVFALESDHPKTSALRQRLIDAGRDTPL